MEKLFKNGVCRLIEFELRLIDLNGDAIDVQHYNTRDEAIRAGKRCVGRNGCVAIVVEKHVSYRPAHLAPSDPDNFTVLYTDGSSDALQAGGWVDNE